MSRLAIIPARGGSKRIPRKNILPFAGKPIIEYAIQAALASGLFDEVMVSTDDQEIATIAKNAGAAVPFFRSDANSNDTATTVAVLLEVLNEYGKQQRFFSEACCIYPANPFLTTSKLKISLEKMINEDLDSVFSAVRYSYPVQRSFVVENGTMKMLFPEHLNTRSQDLPPVYHDAAQFYWFRPDLLQKTEKIWTNHTGIIELPETEVQDIDTAEDWILAELKYQRFKK